MTVPDFSVAEHQRRFGEDLIVSPFELRNATRLQLYSKNRVTFQE